MLTNTACCSEESLRIWFDPLDIVWQAADACLRVLFPHSFFQARFEKLFLPLFEQAARSLWGEAIFFDYALVSERKQEAATAPAQRRANTVPTAMDRHLGENPDAGLGKAPSRAGLAGESEQLTHSPTRSQKGDRAALAPEATFQPSQDSQGSQPTHPALANPFPFGEERTFDTFIANGKHKWALTLAKDLARRAVHSTGYGQEFSPAEPPGLLVLCGGHGTGKTHLLCSVGNELFRSFGHDLCLASIDDLVARFVDSAGSDARVSLRRELSNKRALLIDDVQRLTPADSSSDASAPESELQNELCLLFDRFLEQGKAVLVAGAGHPRDWHLSKALLSRLETGLWAELPEPDLDVRLRYAQQQARLRRLPTNKEQLLLLAQHCADIRRLSGLIRRVASHRALLGRDISEQDILNIIRQGADSSTLTAQSIISIVGEHCGLPAKEILGEKRRPDLVQARQMAMYLCRELLGHSYPVIGRMFGGKDHSTVMHGVKKIKQLQEHDRLVHTMVTELTKACREHRN